MAWMIPLGALITMIGIALLIWCVLRIARAKRANLPDEQMVELMRGSIALNLGALCLSAIGLGLVIVGITLN